MQLVAEEPFLLHILAGFATLTFLAIVASSFVVRFRRPGSVNVADRAFFGLLIGIGVGFDYGGVYCKLFTEVWEQGSEFMCNICYYLLYQARMLGQSIPEAVERPAGG